MREVQRSGRRHRLPHLIATTALAIAAMMIVAQPAAAKDPVGDGLTTLKPTKKIGKALAKGNVKVKPKGSASAGKNGLKFPVTGGKITPGEPDGKVQHQGSRLQLKKGKTKVTLRNPLINLTKAKLNVGVSGSSLKLFELDYSFNPWLWIAGLTGGVFLVCVSGFIAARGAINAPPVDVLRTA